MVSVLCVLADGSAGVSFLVYSCRLILNEDLKEGSQLPYIDRDGNDWGVRRL